MNKMKIFTALLFAACIFPALISGQNADDKKNQKSDSKYDANLAERLGADEYGMKQYVFVSLKTGKAKIEDADKRKKLLEGHMENIGRLADAGKLVLAGPFMDGGDMRGLFIFNVKTVEEARELVKTDPAIREGLFDVEFTKWYGSAALTDVNNQHKKIQKKSF